MLEDASLPPCTSASGYVQSKWVAEGVLQLARARGIPVTIYRPSRISGHSQTGAINGDDFFLRLLAGCMQLGLAPNIPLIENLIPVDYAAEAIVHLSRQPASQDQTFHLLNPRMVDWHWIIAQSQLYGYGLTMVAYRDWYEAVMQIVPGRTDHALHTLHFLIPEDPTQAEWMLAWSAHLCAMPNTQNGLFDSGIDCPDIDVVQLKRMLNDGIARGLFPLPGFLHDITATNSFHLIAA
jgi:thioester reductase-like protein